MSQSPPDPSLQRLNELVAEGEAIEVERGVSRSPDWPNEPLEWSRVDGEAFHRWRTGCIALLDQILPPSSMHRDVLDLYRKTGPSETAKNALLPMLKGLRDVHAKGHLLTVTPQAATEPLVALRLLCKQFHRVVRQLRDRRSKTPKKNAGKAEKAAVPKKRTTLDVRDEYDVQDLMHALLRVFFDDIRPEDPSSWCAGAPSRIDFVLGGHGIVFELKKTRDGLGDKQVGEELIVDTARYRKHPECKTLVAFVYDPEARIGNPAELEQSLSGMKDGLRVEIMIFPKD